MDRSPYTPPVLYGCTIMFMLLIMSIVCAVSHTADYTLLYSYTYDTRSALSKTKSDYVVRASRRDLHVRVCAAASTALSFLCYPGRRALYLSPLSRLARDAAHLYASSEI